MTREEILIKRRKILVCSMLGSLFLGLLYGFSMFALPMQEDFGFDSVGSAFYVLMIAFCIGNLFGSFMLKKLGVRTTLWVAALLYAAGFSITGLLTEQFGVVMLYIGYSLIGGLGTGAIYNPLVSLTNLWFPEKTGTSTGTIMMCFGFSSLILGNLALMLRGVVGGMGPVLVGIGVCGALIAVLLSTQLDYPPEGIVLTMMGDEQIPDEQEHEQDFDPSVQYEDQKCWTTGIFYWYYAFIISVVLMGLGLIGNIASDAMSLGIDVSIATMLVAIASICNGVARFVIGLLVDRIGTPNAMTIVVIVTFAASCCVIFSFFTQNPAIYIPALLMVDFAYAGLPISGATFARKRFGAKNYPFNNAMVNFSVVFGSLGNIILLAIIGDSRITILITSVCILAFGVIAVLQFRRLWHRDLGTYF